MYWHKASGKWKAVITFERKTYSLGSFRHEADAVAAREAANEAKARGDGQLVRYLELTCPKRKT